MMKRQDERRLLLLSGNICAYPGCNLHLFRPDEEVNVMDRAHMVAQRESGPRYDLGFPEELLDTYGNRILLCCNCHRLVDRNPEEHPIGLLRDMKLQHEARIRAIATGPSWKTCCMDLVEFIEDHVKTEFHRYRLNFDTGKREKLCRGEYMGGRKSRTKSGIGSTAIICLVSSVWPKWRGRL